MKNLACQGDERKMAKCGGDFKTESCNHSMDTIIMCEGGDGDTTASTQKNKEDLNIVTLPASTGHLPLPKLLDIDCTTTGT